MLVIDQTFDGGRVALPVGQVLELRLLENPTTGFTWRVDQNGSPACVVAGSEFAAGRVQPGAPGEHIWKIRGVSAGDCQIALTYRRSFETGAAPARTFHVQVHVTP